MTIARVTAPSPAAKDGANEFLQIDAHTLTDLEIFESTCEGPSLFDLCNLTRTDGGVKVLRRRMENPWSSAKDIVATQDSISFIKERREAFAKLPSYITRGVALFQREILMVVAQANRIEFVIGAIALFLNHDRHYRGILHGVQVSCAFIRTLRSFLAQVNLDDAKGELAPYIAEMRELMATPSLAGVPDKDIEGSWFWPVLRLDQVFRIHHRSTILRLLELVYEVDALVAMADVTEKYGWVMPVVEPGALRVQAEGLVHPFVDEPISNPLNLDQRQRVLFLTGPNMAGKTTYLRAFATSLFLAHLGMGVAASSFRFSPCEKLFSSISLADDLRGGVSYFRAEALRVKAVATAVAQKYRVVALMDEPFKGTNVKDALDASLAILQRFSTREDCLFLFSSHLIELDEHLGAMPQVKCAHFEAEEDEGRLGFNYRLRSGVSSQRLGVRVLAEEGVFATLDDGQI